MYFGHRGLRLLSRKWHESFLPENSLLSYQKVVSKCPEHRNNQWTYPDMIPVNRNKGQHSRIILGLSSGIHILAASSCFLLDSRPTQQEGNYVGKSKLANFPCLVMSWILEGNLKPLHIKPVEFLTTLNYLSSDPQLLNFLPLIKKHFFTGDGHHYTKVKTIKSQEYGA